MDEGCSGSSSTFVAISTLLLLVVKNVYAGLERQSQLAQLDLLPRTDVGRTNNADSWLSNISYLWLRAIKRFRCLNILKSTMHTLRAPFRIHMAARVCISNKLLANTIYDPCSYMQQQRPQQQRRQKQQHIDVNRKKKLSPVQYARGKLCSLTNG